MVQGIVKDGCEEYLGIPFAAPPVGELAFKHPVPPEPWDGILKAVRGPISPVQGKGRSTIKVDGKDCLYLNVFRPQELPPDAPVMVWFYGGSYANGGCGRESNESDELVYDLARYARETKTVVVSFNYRLNLEGFLNLHFLDESFDSNNGLYDQMAALKFVRNNIHKFGGDADNITVFGQSAGSACIIALMGMPEAVPLFDKAILQSPCVDSFWSEKQSEHYTRKFLKFAGVDPADLSKLKDLDIETIHLANKKLKQQALLEGESNCAFSPAIDGVTIKGRPADLENIHQADPHRHMQPGRRCFRHADKDDGAPCCSVLVRLQIPSGQGLPPRDVGQLHGEVLHEARARDRQGDRGPRLGL